MEKIDDYKLLKKHYSEKFAQLCRDLFPTILETPGKLYEIISSLFAPNKFLYDDITIVPFYTDRFKEFIYEEYNKSLEEKAEIKEIKTPEELLDEAGYILYECKTEADIQRFRHYYKRNDGKVPVYKEGTKPEIYNGEELCTFSGGRLNQCHVFFAVKKNVDEIKRENFKHPQRQDEYGTSVISIQFTRGKKNYISIKNRYNHTVGNPDATFSNDLDNIIPGLTDAFINKYNLNVDGDKKEFEIIGYVRASDGKLYKYNYEENNIYYCIDNVIIEKFVPRQYDKAKYIVFETTILDLQNKRFTDNGDHFSKITIEKLEQRVNKEKDTREIIINDNIFITLDNQNRIVSYINPVVERIGNHFLQSNRVLEHLELPNVTYIGLEFLWNNSSLKNLNLPKVEVIGYDFMYSNTKLKRIKLPKVKEIGSNFLYYNNGIKKISFPKLERVLDGFLKENDALEYVNLPKLKTIGSYFLSCNSILEELSLPNVERIGSSFLCYNEILKRINLPKVKEIENYFLEHNDALTSISLPNTEFIGNHFLRWNTTLVEDGCIDLPKVKEIGQNFLLRNICLQGISLPEVERVSFEFLSSNKHLCRIELPKVKSIGSSFLEKNIGLKKLSLPNVEIISDLFLYNNKCLHSIELPKACEIHGDFLYSNLLLRRIELPNAVIIGQNFLYNNKALGYINIPKVKKISDGFLYENRCIQKLSLPNVGEIGNEFLYNNRILHAIDVPNIAEVGENFLFHNENPEFLQIMKSSKQKLDYYWYLALQKKF